MNILIVDDEVFTVRAMQTTLDWEKLGIDSVFSAYNVAKAKEIIERENIDLMICDIEMPKEDGISLATWLRERDDQKEIIFLTCHSEFEYAQKALKLKALDYIVKPINFPEMEKIIKRAVEKIEKDRLGRIKTQMGEYWISNKKEMEERFWNTLLTSTASRAPEEIERSANQQSILFNKDETYRLIIVSIKKIKSKLENWNSKLLIFALQNIAKEVILGDIKSNRSVIREDKLIIISQVNKKDEIQSLCVKFMTICRQYLGISVFCYISNPFFCEELAKGYSELCTLEKNDVAGSQEIVFADERNIQVEDSEIILPKQWKQLVEEGKKEDFLLEYKRFVDSIAEKNVMTYHTLKAVQKELLVFFFFCIERKNLQVNKIDLLDFDNTIESLEELNSWVENSVNMIWDYANKKFLTSNELVTEKIINYILEHLNEELTRENLAGRVGLSPDYISRVFKQEMDTTLSQYIIDERMKKAVLLMRTTNLNVSQIAIEVGYDNFSYFSKLFKKHTGYAPRVYRMSVKC